MPASQAGRQGFESPRPLSTQVEIAEAFTLTRRRSAMRPGGRCRVVVLPLFDPFGWYQADAIAQDPLLPPPQAHRPAARNMTAGSPSGWPRAAPSTHRVAARSARGTAL